VKQAKSAATVPSIERQLEKSLDELIGSKRSPATPIAEPATCKLPSTATSQATTSTTPPAPAKITPSTTNVPVEKQQSTKQKDHPDQAPVTGAVPVQSSPAPVLERVEAEASDDGALVHQSLAEQAEVHRLQAMMRQRTGGRRLAPPSKTLWIGNLPATANRRTLQSVCSFLFSFLVRLCFFFLFFNNDLVGRSTHCSLCCASLSKHNIQRHVQPLEPAQF
jgi:hypothetical protein